MFVKDTHLHNLAKEIHKFKFGTVYFFDYIIISEINEGELFDWDMVMEIDEKKKQFYTIPNKHINYISNRVNDYAVRPDNWGRYLSEYDPFEIYAVVTYRKTAATNLAIEQVFYKSSIFSFENLFEAINFISQRTKLKIVDNFEDLKKN